jgi:diguanylate cyclase (GGDEF)-like protein/PAS domain S-box-containing protein
VLTLLIGGGIALALMLASLLTVQRDFRELSEVAEALAAAEERFRDLADHASDLVRLIEPNGKCSYVSPSVKSLLGYEPAELLALNALELPHPDDLPGIRETVAPVLAGQTERGALTARLRHKSGEYRWFDSQFTALRDADGKVDRLQVASRDVHTRKLAEQALAEKTAELEALSLRDALTGLANRRGFVELAGLALKVARRERRPCAVVFLDLDGLKPINDQLGHEVGDRAIREAARVLREACRDTDIVARLGGDELALFGLDLNQDNFGGLQCRLEEAIERATPSRAAPSACRSAWARRSARQARSIRWTSCSAARTPRCTSKSARASKRWRAARALSASLPARRSGSAIGDAAHDTEELVGIVGLEQVIFDTAGTDRVRIVAAGKHEHRRREQSVVAADDLQKLGAVKLGHFHVQQDQRRRRRLSRDEEIQRRATIGELHHGKALALQEIADGGPKLCVVIDDPHALRTFGRTHDREARHHSCERIARRCVPRISGEPAACRMRCSGDSRCR